MGQAITLAELAQRSEVPARTIRFYIARGLLPGPAKAGRAAAYTEQHLARLDEIKKLQAEGRTLSGIAQLLADESTTQPQTPSQWWQHPIDDDVLVFVRANVDPWRMKQIRAAVGVMASALGKPANNNVRRNRK